MLLQALIRSVNVRGEIDRAALTVHSTLLEHGFICVGLTEQATGGWAPSLGANADGSTGLQVLPAGWNASADSFTFSYIHPLRGEAESFTVKMIAIGETLTVHAASSLNGGELLNALLNVNRGAAAVSTETQAASVKDWQEKTAAGIALRLLSQHNSTARLGKSLDGASGIPAESGSGARRPSERERPQPGREPLREDNPRFTPQRDPFSPGFFDQDRRPPLFWAPDGGGGLVGPRHPAWGQVVPGGMGSGGMMPRFDPIGPGMIDPDPDHFRDPGRFPDGGPPGFPGMPGRSGMPGRGGNGFPEPYG